MDYSYGQMIFGICWLIIFPLVLYAPHYFNNKRLKRMQGNIGKVFRINPTPVNIKDEDPIWGEMVVKITDVSLNEIPSRHCYETSSYRTHAPQGFRNRLVHYSHIDNGVELEEDEWLLLMVE